MTIELPVFIDKKYIIDGIVDQHDYDDIIQFVKELDKAMNDIDFSEDLCKFFMEEMRIFYKETDNEELVTAMDKVLAKMRRRNS